MPTTKKLKIIHTEASPHWGGQEIRIFEEMKWFREQGHEMILIAPDNGTLYKRCKKEGFKVISVYFTKPRTLLNILIMLWVIWKLKPNAVATHSSTDSWAGLIAAYLLKIKKRIRYRHISAAVKGNFLNKLQYKTFANVVLTTGECVKSILLNSLKLDPAKITVAPTPMSPIEFQVDKFTARQLVQKELGLPDETRFVGQISVLRSWKGHETLIDAFNIFANSYPYYHLLIVGDGPRYKYLNSYIKKKESFKKIHFLGFKNNPTKYFNAMEYSLLASFQNEGIPQSILQSMQLGTPTVGTNIGGIPEIVKNYKTGLLVAPNDPEEMAIKMKELTESSLLRKEMSDNCAEYIKNYFLWESRGKVLENLFNQ